MSVLARVEDMLKQPQFDCGYRYSLLLWIQFEICIMITLYVLFILALSLKKDTLSIEGKLSIPTILIVPHVGKSLTFQGLVASECVKNIFTTLC